MELKLSNQEEDNVKSSGLKLSGESDPSTKTEKVEMDNPWDFDRGNEVKELKSIREQAINDIDAYTSNRTASLNDINIVVKIGKYVVYLCALLMIGAMIMICKKPQIDMYQSLTSMSSVFSFCEFLFILDAILVIMCYTKKRFLLLYGRFYSHLFIQ